MWDTMHLAVFAFAMATACLYFFIGWLSEKIGTSQSAQQSDQKDSTGRVRAMSTGQASGGVSTPTGKTGNPEDVSQQSSEIINQLVGKIRELEGRNLDASTRAQGLEQQIKEKNQLLLDQAQGLTAAQKANQDLNAANMNERSQRLDLSNLLDQTLARASKESMASEESAKLYEKETLMRKSEETRYADLHALSEIIADRDLIHLLHKFDDKERKGRNDGTGRSDLMERGNRGMRSYLLSDAARAARMIRNTKNDERNHAINETAALERDLEEARCEIRSLKAESASRALSSDLEAVSQHATWEAAFEEQRNEHNLAVAILEADHSVALTAQLDHIDQLERELQTERETVAAFTAVSGLDNAGRLEDAEAREEVIADRVQEIFDLDRELRKVDRQLQYSRETTKMFSDALEAKEEALRNLKSSQDESVASATMAVQNANASEIASLRQQVAESTVREGDLAVELSDVKVQRMEDEAQMQQQIDDAMAERQKLIDEGNGLLADRANSFEKINSLESECRLLKRQLENVQSRGQGGQTSALGDAHAKIVELQAKNNDLVGELRLARQTSADARTVQQIEQLRSRVQALEKVEQDSISDKIRFTNKVKGLEEELQRSKRASSNNSIAFAPRQPKRNPLQAKVDELKLELEQANSQLTEKSRLLEELEKKRLSGADDSRPSTRNPGHSSLEQEVSPDQEKPVARGKKRTREEDLEESRSKASKHQHRPDSEKDLPENSG